jgi:hypothetical protein
MSANVIQYEFGDMFFCSEMDDVFSGSFDIHFLLYLLCCVQKVVSQVVGVSSFDC